MSKIAKLRKLADELIRLTHENESRRFVDDSEREAFHDELIETRDKFGAEITNFYESPVRRLARKYRDSLEKYKAGDDEFVNVVSDILDDDERYQDIMFKRGEVTPAEERAILRRLGEPATHAEWVGEDNLREAMRRLPRMPVDTYVYRGIPRGSNRGNKKFHTGKSIPSALSTSVDPWAAAHFGDDVSQYFVPKGSPAVGLDALRMSVGMGEIPEAEILLPVVNRGASNFRVERPRGTARKLKRYRYKPPFKSRGGAVRV